MCLAGVTVVLAFIEDSTRTRTAFPSGISLPILCRYDPSTRAGTPAEMSRLQIICA